MPNEIKTISVFSPRDESVGIHDYWVELSDSRADWIAEFDWADPEERQELIEEFRQKLKEAFELVLDGPVSVTFDIDRPEPKFQNEVFCPCGYDMTGIFQENYDLEKWSLEPHGGTIDGVIEYCPECETKFYLSIVVQGDAVYFDASIVEEE